MGVTVAVTRVAANTATGTQDITTADLGGLTPKAALFFVSGAATDGTAAANSRIGYGFTDGTTSRARSLAADDAVATANTGVLAVTAPIVIYNNAGTDGQADFSAWITNGIRINWIDAPATAVLITAIFSAGSDLTVKVGAIGVGNTVDLETDVNTVGFEPDIVFAGIDVSVSQMGRMSLGVARNNGDATVTQRALVYHNRDNVGTTELYAHYLNNRTCADTLNHGPVNYAIEVANFDSSGFSFITRVRGGLNHDIAYLAMSFGGAVETYVGDYTTPTGTGNDAETGPGFEPQAVVMGASLIETANTQISNANAGTFGLLAFDDTDAYCNTGTGEDAATTTNEQSLSDDTAVQVPLHDGSAGIAASFVSFDATGFTLNYSTVTANSKFFWVLAIEAEAAGGAISGETTGVATVTGALTGKGALSGTASAIATVTAAIAAIGSLAGTIAGTSTASATLSAKSSIAGTSAGTSTASGALVASGELAGQASGQATVSGTLAASGDLAGTSAGQATATGDLSATGDLAGTSEGVATVTGILTEVSDNALVGTAAGTSTATGVLTASGALAGTSDGLATTQGQLAGTGALAGDAAGTGAATANLIGAGQLAGTSDGVATATAALYGVAELAGTSAGFATVSGDLTFLSGAISGTAAGQTTTTGVLTATGELIGIANGVATVAGILVDANAVMDEMRGVIELEGEFAYLVTTIQGEFAYTVVLEGEL